MLSELVGITIDEADLNSVRVSNRFVSLMQELDRLRRTRRALASNRSSIFPDTGELNKLASIVVG